jgi:hypothetical protein
VAAKPAFLDTLTASAGHPPDKQGVATVNGRTFSHALTYTSDYSGVSTSWSLGGRFRRFSALISEGDCQLSCSDNQTLFEVAADGRNVISQQISDGQVARVAASIPGAQVLKLSMSFVKTYPGEETWYWGDPKVAP